MVRTAVMTCCGNLSYIENGSATICANSPLCHRKKALIKHGTVLACAISQLTQQVTMLCIAPTVNTQFVWLISQVQCFSLTTNQRYYFSAWQQQLCLAHFL
jgi:hypothetical protein